MFAFNSRIVAVTLAAVVAVTVDLVFVSAIPAEGSKPCGLQNLKCCDSVAANGTSSDDKILGLIPINLQNLGVPIGLNCVPLSIVGLGSSGTCDAQAACCEKVDNSGVIPIGVQCNPIDFSL